MTRMPRAVVALLIAAASLALASPLTTATAGASLTRSGSPSGTQVKGTALADKFLRLLEAEDRAGLRRFLSPAFQLQRADGTYVNKAEYLAKPAIVESHQIDNVRATRVGDVIVVRFDLVVDATIDGLPQSIAPAPRLATFHKGPNGWQLLAYANFNTPAAEPAT